jgi:hypothetical protein
MDKNSWIEHFEMEDSGKPVQNLKRTLFWLGFLSGLALLC